MPDKEPADEPKRFRIAFSFAGEKREYVEKVANILAARFGKDKILYDKFHEAEFARYDLGIRLPKLYGEQSNLIVPVICPHYDDKRWTGWEWVHIYGLLTKEEGHRVMPSRFEYAQVDGLGQASAFIELDDKTPEQVAELILERLALNEGRVRDHYTNPVVASGAAPRTPIPHNLPSLQPFFGREDELKKIADALDPESRTWGAIIDGPGGMGKTSLAVRAAYDASPKAFDKIIFVSLKSRELDDDGVRDLSGFLVSGLAELFSELARELGNDQIAKATESERPRLLIDALRGTKALLILDNLESLTKSERDLVFNFVKRLPPGCKAILTSRGRIGSAAEELILGKLSEEAALQTLAKLSEINPALAKVSVDERLQLYSETGGKPLLLRWTAGQIGRGNCITFADTISYLRSCPKGNDPLEFIFGDLIEDFSEAEARTLCALTYFTLPAKVEHIAAIAERDEAETEQALKSLINRSIVVPSEELRTFSLVPLVADFLRVKKPDLLHETGDRLEVYAYTLVVENGFRKFDRFPILEEAWPLIAASLPGILAGDNQRLQTVCYALENFLDFTGRWDEWLALPRDAEVRAIASGDLVNAGWRAYQAGLVHILRGQPADVLSCADRAEAHWVSGAANVRLRATAVRLRGIGHRLGQNYPAAIATFKKTVEMLRSLGRQSQDIAIAMNALAIAEHLSGDLGSAERDYNEALRMARAVGYREGVAEFTGTLAGLALDRRDWLGAENLARQALELSENIGRLELIADNCLCLAESLVGQGKKEEARPYSDRAIETFKKLGSPKLERAQQSLGESEGDE